MMIKHRRANLKKKVNNDVIVNNETGHGMNQVTIGDDDEMATEDMAVTPYVSNE
jgi:hypothetical protein